MPAASARRYLKPTEEKRYATKPDQAHGRRDCAVAGLSTAAAQEIDSVVKKLQATNTITLGYRETLLPTSYLDDQKKPTGYAIEMCMRILDEVKAELKLPQIKVDYVPVNIQNRQALVANGTVQLECGGTVNTFARNKQVDFSPVSYVAASQLLVLKSSHIAKFEDLNGKIVAVATGGSSEPELKHIIETNKLNVRVHQRRRSRRRADRRREPPRRRLFQRQRRVLQPDQAVEEPAPTCHRRARVRLLAARLHGARRTIPTFLWIVNHAMGKMFKSGEAEKIFDKWFGPFGARSRRSCARRGRPCPTPSDAAAVNYPGTGGSCCRTPTGAGSGAGLGWTLLISLGSWTIALVVGIDRRRRAKHADRASSRWWRASTSRSSATSRRWSSCSSGTSSFPRWCRTRSACGSSASCRSPEFVTAIVGIGLFAGARVAEQVRAGVAAVGIHLMPAALATGLRPLQAFRLIMLPLGLRAIVGPLTSEFLITVKMSSISLTIGMLELTAQSRHIENYTFHGLEAFAVATVGLPAARPCRDRADARDRPPLRRRQAAAGVVVSDFDWGVIARSWPFLAEGMALSALLVAVATAGGLVLGFGLALMRRSRTSADRRAGDGLRDGDALRAADPGPVLVLLPGAAGRSAARSARWPRR